MFKIGIGYDVHKLTLGRPMIIGGVKIDSEVGLLGHSDADVLLHACMDAILGALSLGDIGKHFPDTDAAFKGASSLELMHRVYDKMTIKGFKIGNIDAVIIAEKPKMAPYIEEMVMNISRVLSCSPSVVNVKATTTEKLGFEGREEGIASQAVVLLEKIVP